MIATANIYLKDGKGTLDSDKGKNRLVVRSGSKLDTDTAQRLGARTLFEEADKSAVEAAQKLSNPLGDVEEPKKVKLAPKTEVKS